MNDDRISRCDDLDERLAPYVDGEATPDACRSVEAHLAACPACRDRAAGERAARDIVRECRSRLHPAAPPGLRARCEAHRRGPAVPARFFTVRRWVPLSLAATLLLAVAGVFLFSAIDRADALAAGLTLDHVKCFQFRAAATAPVDSESLARAWEVDQGWPLVVPATEPAQSLRLLAVRRCLSTDGRVAHLMYLWRGEPLSVFVLPRAVSRSCLIDSMGHEAAVWSANGRTYAVLVKGHPADFDGVVNYVKTHAR